MDRARYVVDAVVGEGRPRSVRSPRAMGSPRAGWEPWSRGTGAVATRRSSHGPSARTRSRAEPPTRLRTPSSRCARSWSTQGFDAGPHTIHWHLSKKRHDVPSALDHLAGALSPGLRCVPEPRKRPHSSFVRFEAALPNECWQADITHWKLADGHRGRHLGLHRRPLPACRRRHGHRRTTKARDVTATMHRAGFHLGLSSLGLD